MALTTPILYNVPAFDAAQAQIFAFNSLGGSQVTGSTLTIKDNVTLQTVYSQTQISYRFEHILPANALVNGTYYQATLTTRDAEDNVSNPSVPIQFYCFTTPEFTISNMPHNNVIGNSSFSFNVTYNQIQGELLNAYVFNLYSASGALISTSSTLYNLSTDLPLNVSYLFSGFEDKASYSIEVTGVTVNGTQITTGRVQFTTDYTLPDVFSFLNLTNNCKGGYITIKSNVIGIPGTANPVPPVFINNEEVDLRQENSFVVWPEAYEITKDFTMRLWGRDFKPNTEILRFSNANGDIIYLYYIEDDTNAWFEMRAVHQNWQFGYTCETQHIVKPSSAEQLFCWMRSIGNLYDLMIENRGVEV